MSRTHKDLLGHAYRAGLIAGWKKDGEHRYRLTLGNQRDEYVKAAMLTAYLERLLKKRR